LRSNTDPAPAYGHPAPTWAGSGWRIVRHEECLERSKKYKLENFSVSLGVAFATYGNRKAIPNNSFEIQVSARETFFMAKNLERNIL
jgi:hypothetical protein